MSGDEPLNIADVSDKYDKRHENGKLDALWVRPIGAANGHIWKDRRVNWGRDEGADGR